MAETRKQKFLNNIYNTKIGSISQDQYVYAPNNNARQMDNPDWELRFSLFPDQENINKAAEAIAHTLLSDEKTNSYDLAFKIINFNKIADSTKLNSWRAMGAEGPFTTLEGLSDRDQRGKEFCLYLRFKKITGASEKSSREWKDIILKIWKALQDAKIKMGYINPQIGDISLSSETVTPVSYLHAINRNWANLTTLFWEILHREDISLDEKKEQDNKITGEQRPLLTDQLYEIDWKKYENKKTNPLAGIHISLQDIEKAGISYASIYQMQKDKVTYLQDHSADALTFVTKELAHMTEEIKEMSRETLKSAIFEKLSLLETIVTDLEKNPLHDTLPGQMKQVVDDIAILIPREDKYGILRLPSQIDELINMRFDFNKEKCNRDISMGF